MARYLNTDELSAKYRQAAIDINRKRLLVANFRNTEQEKDLTEPPNCNGFGRIRHFTLSQGDDWPLNPLPIVPACKALGISVTPNLRVQVFQNAVCNWRCWYCYVPFNLLSADPKHTDWLSPSDLIEMYLGDPSPPPIIDLSGGQPDLIPEWVLWMMSELKSRKMEHSVYLWSDDNLSNDYFWRYLTSDDIKLITEYRNYGRVCCFKGFDNESFSFNTMADPDLFNRQFDIMQRFLKLDIDLYAYVTMTAASDQSIDRKMRSFVDRLQQLHEFLPLRAIPLRIRIYSPVYDRITNLDSNKVLMTQDIAMRAWKDELQKRYSSKELSLNITDVPMRKKGN